MGYEFWRIAPDTPCTISDVIDEREEIALQCARGTGIRAIARKLSRSPSMVSREIRRNFAILSQGQS
ncbi:helix-turn-helix domain-containing protein [Sagittula marina]|uniref:helix-turn-helix domain-containing protein n=1 Tax=Sagittula marina TaxID=943940 RepID=UPI0031B5F2E5